MLDTCTDFNSGGRQLNNLQHQVPFYESLVHRLPDGSRGALVGTA